MTIKKVSIIVAMLTFSLLLVAVPASAVVNLFESQNPAFDDFATLEWWSGSNIRLEFKHYHTGSFSALIGSNSEDNPGTLYHAVEPPSCAEELVFWYLNVEGLTSDYGTVTIIYEDDSEYGPFTIPLTTTWTTHTLSSIDQTKLVKGISLYGNGLMVDDFDLEACGVPTVPEFGLGLPLLISVVAIPLLILLQKKHDI